MRLADEYVVFHLSPEGLHALSTLLPPQFSAWVREEDELGVWIYWPRKLGEKASLQAAVGGGDRELIHVLLLKREYFSTATLEVDLKSPGSHPDINVELA